MESKLVDLWLRNQVDPTHRVQVSVDPQSRDSRADWGDFVAEVGLRLPAEKELRRWRYSVEVKNRADIASVRRALSLSRPEGIAPLFTSGLITERIGAVLSQAGISWLDMAGNYYLTMGDAVFERVGQRGAGIPGREPRDMFAPKASRIVRLLLSFPSHVWRTTDLAEQAGLDAGYTSRVLQSLSKSGYVERNKSAWSLIHPSRLLEDWRHDYKFGRHDSRGFFSLTPRVEQRMHAIQEANGGSDARLAFTGAPAAGLWGVLAAVDQVVAYVESSQGREYLVGTLKLIEETGAPNVLLAVPEDEGVFIPTELREGLQVVGRPQIFLDLQTAPRGEALASDFEARLPWRS